MIAAAVDLVSCLKVPCLRAQLENHLERPYAEQAKTVNNSTARMGPNQEPNHPKTTQEHRQNPWKQLIRQPLVMWKHQSRDPDHTEAHRRKKVHVDVKPVAAREVPESFLRPQTRQQKKHQQQQQE